MKSAEEWRDDAKNWPGLSGWIRAIQADAKADGMRCAAEIVCGYDVGYDARTGEGWRTRKEIGELVLAEADRIEKGSQTQ